MMIGFELFNGLNARSYAFRVHFRELCPTILDSLTATYRSWYFVGEETVKED